MGFFAKLKEFGSKIINKIRKPKLDPNLLRNYGNLRTKSRTEIEQNMKKRFDSLSPEEQQKHLEKIPKIKLLNN